MRDNKKLYTWTIWHTDYQHKGPSEVFTATKSDAMLRIRAIYSSPKNWYEKVEA